MAATLKRRLAKIRRALERRFGRIKRPVKRRRTGLDTLVQTILSQNTNDANSGEAFRRLKRRFPSWRRVLAAPKREVERAIRVGGLAAGKARAIRNTLRWLARERGRMSLDFVRALPTDKAMAALTRLGGVGVKTAAVTLCFAYGREVFPVDTHIRRVSVRLGLAPDKSTAERVFDMLAPHVPRGAAYGLHLQMIRLGREVCHARAPECPRCPLARTCPYPGRRGRR